MNPILSPLAFVVAVAGVWFGLLALTSTNSLTQRLDALPGIVDVGRDAPFTWPGLSEQQHAHLVAGLQAVAPKLDVTIWCATANCTNLAEDLQYTAYMADWDTHSEMPVMGSGEGLRVSPDDAAGKAIARALADATGLKVGTEPGPTVGGKPTQPAGSYNIILGARR